MGVGTEAIGKKKYPHPPVDCVPFSVLVGSGSAQTKSLTEMCEPNGVGEGCPFTLHLTADLMMNFKTSKHRNEKRKKK
jgi:hypothetical protein